MVIDFSYINTRWNDLKKHPAFKKAPAITLWRLGTWMVHCTFGVSAVIKLPKWGCKFYVPPKFRRAGSTGIFLLREDYDPELAYIQKTLSEGQVFIDGGANFGIYTVLASQVVGKSGKVFAFEPGNESFAVLSRNKKINQMDNTKLFQAALSNQKGVTRLYHIDNAPNSYSIGGEAQSQGEFEEVATITLDHLAADENLERVDMIKLDVEGAEELVLQGGQMMLKEMSPILLFEVSKRAMGRLNLSKEGVTRILQDLNYHFFKLNSVGELVKVDTPQTGNNIAIPASKDSCE
ncbi:FkbM family methyltransferase [Spirulina sp. CS-785/01]|uniref:FkbM family methyltransferase n=1 Tax=Spirulina sp. CS-785/01 TaxID=3021716 RepID=UPI00232DAC87|nr:FkbM family methyltransferase [Spirulina sp. CS-785/01]MDB9315906.1 FkbM family methyltransferase [Spirulina sp. CS-785/01]